MDLLVNRLVPHYLSGRRFILLLQSLVYPLQSLNDHFRTFAKEKHVEARMTSQIIYFEWYLNYRFKSYFSNSEDRIYIRDSTSLGVDIYHEVATNAKPFTIWFENEQVATIQPDEQPRELYLPVEEKQINKVSFMVCVPSVTISQQEFVFMLSYAVNTYRIAGKTYLIAIAGEEFEPNITTSV